MGRSAATISNRAAALLVAALQLWAITAFAQSSDPLPSWNDRSAKQAIVEFVKAVTTEGSADFVQPDDRIATFDQDGTRCGSSTRSTPRRCSRLTGSSSSRQSSRSTGVL
jgi:hypothetical protein